MTTPPDKPESGLLGRPRTQTLDDVTTLRVLFAEFKGEATQKFNAGAESMSALRHNVQINALAIAETNKTLEGLKVKPPLPWLSIMGAVLGVVSTVISVAYNYGRESYGQEDLDRARQQIQLKVDTLERELGVMDRNMIKVTTKLEEAEKSRADITEMFNRMGIKAQHGR